jgi:pimeloyl-ACP methyl ester carboxylesterase
MSFWTDTLGMAFEIKYVDAGGTRTRTLIAGKGAPIIFLHGISGHLEAYVGSARAFVDAGFQIHLIDQIGQGYTDKLKVPMTMQIMADHVIRYMDALGLKKAHLAGLSLGGWTAAWVAAHYPDRVISTQLISAAGDPGSKPAKDPKMGEWLRQSTRDGVLGDWEATKKRLLTVVTDQKTLTDELIDVRHAIYKQPSFIAALDNLLGMTSPEAFNRWALTTEVLAKIQCEVLVIWGENDFAMGDGPKWLVEGIKHVKLVTFSGNSHWPQYERPADYARVAIEFLRGGLAGVTAAKM